MIKKITINNYKSINDLTIGLGSLNVFIGENGSGKSNILESLAFASSAINGTVENEQLALRGVRITDTSNYRSGFSQEDIDKKIQFTIVSNDDHSLSVDLANDNQPFSKWEVQIKVNKTDIEADVKREINEFFSQNFDTGSNKSASKREDFNLFVKELVEKYTHSYKPVISSFNFSDFLIYAPENYFLRNYNVDEPHIEPLGYRGEGILKLIKIIKTERPKQYEEIIENLYLVDWLDKFEIDESNIANTEFKLTDRYLEDGLRQFDIRSANEGFLFLLFYFTLFISDYTPKIFSIDNIDTALNPKLCARLTTILSSLANKYNKQVIITTHNPSILDGLDLNNEDQRLYVVSRGIEGNTIATRVTKKAALPGAGYKQLYL